MSHKEIYIFPLTHDETGDWNILPWSLGPTCDVAGVNHILHMQLPAVNRVH